MNDLYHWSDREIVAHDPLVQHKSAFLNVPFFMARMIIYFVLWVFFIRKLRSISLSGDMADPSNMDGIMTLFSKSELYSKIFIFILAVTIFPLGL